MKKERKAAPVPEFLRKAHEDSKRKGTDKITHEEIQLEIKSARRERRLKHDKHGT